MRGSLHLVHLFLIGDRRRSVFSPAQPSPTMLCTTAECTLASSRPCSTVLVPVIKGRRDDHARQAEGNKAAGGQERGGMCVLYSTVPVLYLAARGTICTLRSSSLGRLPKVPPPGPRRQGEWTYYPNNKHHTIVDV